MTGPIQCHSSFPLRVISQSYVSYFESPIFRDNGRRSSESNESPNSSAGHLGGTVTTLSNQTSAFKPHLPRNGLLTPTSSSSSPSGSHGTHLPPSSSPMYKSGSLTNESQDLRMSSGKTQRRPSSPMDFHDAEERPLVIEENQKDEEGGEDEEGNHHESSPLHHAYGETLDLSNKGGSRPNSSHSQRSPLGIGQQTSPLLGLIKSHQASVVTPSFPNNNNNNNTNNSGTPLPIMATHINTASVVAPVPVSITGRVSGGQVLEGEFWQSSFIFSGCERVLLLCRRSVWKWKRVPQVESKAALSNGPHNMFVVLQLIAFVSPLFMGSPRRAKMVSGSPKIQFNFLRDFGQAWWALPMDPFSLSRPSSDWAHTHNLSWSEVFFIVSDFGNS